MYCLHPNLIFLSNSPTMCSPISPYNATTGLYTGSPSICLHNLFSTLCILFFSSLLNTTTELASEIFGCEAKEWHIAQLDLTYLNLKDGCCAPWRNYLIFIYFIHWRCIVRIYSAYLYHREKESEVETTHVN